MLNAAARTIRRLPLIVAVVFAGLSVRTFARTLPECAEQAYAADVAAKQEWQRGLRDAIVKLRPDLATPATLDMELQLVGELENARHIRQVVPLCY